MLDLPFELQPWEPEYCARRPTPTSGIDAPSPAPPSRGDHASSQRRGTVAPEVRTTTQVVPAVRQLLEPWTASSNGRADVVCVEGTAADATRHARRAPGASARRAHPRRRVCAWLAWAGASGGAHGRRRGNAIGRFGAWWVLAALVGLPPTTVPVDPDELGELAADLHVVPVGRRRTAARLGAATRDRGRRRRSRLGDQRPRRPLTHCFREPNPQHLRATLTDTGHP